MSRQQTDPLGADLLFKAVRAITMLWRECALHDNLTATAEQVLDATEARLHECLERQSIAEAAEALAEVKRLKSVIKDPPDAHKPWFENM